jgi:hypothetical protein
MAFTLKAGISGIPIDDNPTTVAIDTTAAKVIVALVVHELGSGTFGDSAGNTWTEVTVTDADTRTVRGFYCISPNTSATHTFTFTGSQVFGSVGAIAFLADGTPVLDQQATNGSASSTTLRIPNAGSISAAAGVAVALAECGDNIASIDDTFTLHDDEGSSGGGDGNAVAYRILASPASLNPTFTQGNADRIAGFVLTFTEGGGGSQPTLGYIATHMRPSAFSPGLAR